MRIFPHPTSPEALRGTALLGLSGCRGGFDGQMFGATDADAGQGANSSANVGVAPAGVKPLTIDAETTQTLAASIHGSAYCARGQW